jgi:transposase
MRINQAQYEKIAHILPIQRGNAAIGNVTFINALLYICENGCKWRRLPKEYGGWHAIYKRFHRWVKAGILDKLFREPRAQDVLDATNFRGSRRKLRPEALFVDSTIIRVHPDACGALKKRETGDRPLQRRTDDQGSHDAGK